MLNVTESQRATEFKRDLEDKTKFIALGELKGGIDPAGADEHWKTASTALQRIRDKFKGFNIPELFFAGAAIEEAMAKQIYAQLQDGSLSFAANYTSEEQLQALVHWLISL